MALKPVEIDCLTPNYRICGQMYVGVGGVAGALIDSRTSYIEIHNARMARIHSYETLIPSTNVISVMKNQLQATCLKNRDDIGPSTTRFGKVNNLLSRITTSVYEIEGMLEWSGRFEFPMLIAEGYLDYVPIYDASIAGILYSSLLMQSPIILFNRKQIATFRLITENL